MEIITLDQIKQILPSLDLIQQIEQGFRRYSEGRVTVPPVGEMILDKGEVHIKYGYVEGEAYYVIKIASGFYGNPALGQPSGNGMMLLYRQETGEPVSILLDQARLQLLYLKNVVKCREILAHGRSGEKMDTYKSEMEKEGYNVEATSDPSEILKQCNLIVTTTPSKSPILNHGELREGTHITAMGSDTPDKQELDSLILGDADLVVTDSIEQCMVRGEIHRALAAGHLKKEGLIELGNVISGSAKGRTSDQQITIADLTGVAVQDISIATAVYKAVTG
jgi:ornithine cyclodeaminase